MNKLYFILSLLLGSTALMAQENDLMRDIEHSIKSERDRKIELAYNETTAGNYKAAEILYLEILNSGEAIPSNLAFYFGKNSFYLKKYTQSLDWLNKYIALKGTDGTDFPEAKELISKIKEELQKERAAEFEQTVVIFSEDYAIDCGPSGKVICPVCQGETVIIQKTAFGKSYKTCTYCDKDGNMNCEEYNKLLKGELTH